MDCGSCLKNREKETTSISECTNDDEIIVEEKYIYLFIFGKWLGYLFYIENYM